MLIFEGREVGVGGEGTECFFALYGEIGFSDGCSDAVEGRIFAHGYFEFVLCLGEDVNSVAVILVFELLTVHFGDVSVLFLEF